MKNLCKLFFLIYIVTVPISVLADTCRDTYQRIKFFSAIIWQGDDISPPVVKCIYNDDIPRRPDPRVSYTLPGKFAPVSGYWLTYNGQSQCWYKNGPCVFNKID